MAELSDETVLKIKNHLMAVADLLGGVQVPKKRRGGLARTQVRKVDIMESARSLGGSMFTAHQLREVLAAKGLPTSPGNIATHLHFLRKEGLLEMQTRGHYRVKANGHG